MPVCVNVRNARVVKGMGGILHNMLYRVAAARQPIRDEGAVNIFQRFRECSDSMIACKALILQVPSHACFATGYCLFCTVQTYLFVCVCFVCCFCIINQA